MMKRRYFIHVLVILVLVASLLIGFTSGALGKYTNVGLGVFSTLAFVNFSDYDVVGGVIVDDGSGDTIKPGDISDSLWGPGEDIDEGSHENGYGWDDADDVSFVVANESEKDIYLTFVVRMAIPNLVLTSFRFNYTIDAVPTIDGTTIRYPEIGEGTLYTSTSGQEGDNVFYRVKDKEGNDIKLYTVTSNDDEDDPWWLPSVDYDYYLEEVEIDTSIVLKPGESYQCHLHFSIPNGISSLLAELFADGAAYYSIAIKARKEL